MPPPTHMVTIPYRALRRFISCMMRRRQLGPGAAQRMPQRDRAAVDIHLAPDPARLLDHGQRLRGESFVQLDQVDLVPASGPPS